MVTLLEILVGLFTVGLPVWFAFQDHGVFPRLRWVEGDDPPPLWGRLVVVVGLGLVVLIALSVPLSELDPTH